VSGHNKWSTIKHKKGAEDAKRGRLFSKLIREITVSARDGGGDINFNPGLRSIIDMAKEANMPADNIKNAIKRGTGEMPGVNYEDITYEGYGPAGVAIMIKTLTDNKNRTVAEIRHIFDKYGGSLGESGSVGWMFNKKGTISVDKSSIGEDDLMEKALEAGAEDINTEDPDSYDIYTLPEQVHAVADSLKKAGVTLQSVQVSYIPTNLIKVEGKNAEKVLRVMDKIEDQEDVQEVYSNFDISDEDIAAFQGD